jgi:hypothetical protein
MAFGTSPFGCASFGADEFVDPPFWVRQLDSDTFTYSDGELATVSGGKWTRCTISANDVHVASNQIHDNSTEHATVITSWAGSLTQQWSEVLFISGNFGGPTIFNDGASTFYLAELQDGVPLVLYWVQSGSFTNIANGGTTTPGHTYRIRVETPGTIIVSDNGADIITQAHSSITSGKPGLRSWANIMDNWKAGDFSLARPRWVQRRNQSMQRASAR